MSTVQPTYLEQLIAARQALLDAMIAGPGFQSGVTKYTINGESYEAKPADFMAAIAQLDELIAKEQQRSAPMISEVRVVTGRSRRFYY